MIRRLLLAGTAAVFVASFPAYAVEVSGEYRNLGFYTKDIATGNPLWTDLNRLRLQADATGDSFAAQLIYDHELLYGGTVTTPTYRAARSIPEATYFDAHAYVAEKPRYDWRHGIYRGWVQYSGESGRITLGRQRVAWGSGRLWNPSDRFNPVAPTALEADEKLGVDAIFAQYDFSGFGAVQAVYAPGRVARGVSEKSAIRWRDTFGETDVAMMVGAIGHERIAAVDLFANVNDGGLYVEAVFADPKQTGRYTQFVAGYDYTINNDLLPAGLRLLIEYFYNGAASPLTALATASDRLNSVARQQLGVSAGYDLTPLWRLQGTAIFDLDQGSRFVSPQLAWSAADNIDVSAFAMLFYGRAGSEYGGQKHLYALQFQYYF